MRTFIINRIVTSFSVLAAFLTLTAVAPAGQTKHIILFIGDGMHLEHEIAGSRYLTGQDSELSFHKFPMQACVVTWDVTTYNLYAKQRNQPAYHPRSFDPSIGYDIARGGDAPFRKNTTPIDDAYYLTRLEGSYPATDSASASTAMATGIKTDSGKLAWLPGNNHNGAVSTIAERARAQRGHAIGVVSTVPFSHATPAGFVSHNKNRKNYHAIADEILRVVCPEVVIGGGHPKWQNDFLSPTLYADARRGALGDYIFVERVTGQDGSAALADGAARAMATGKKLFGLFGGSGGCFDIPQPHEAPDAPRVKFHGENPSLASATQSALRVLSGNPNGFFVMIEQGDIDWSNHDNHYRNMIGGIVDLHQAVQAAVDFIHQPDDDLDWSNTLIIVTSDHANSYMRLADDNKLGPGRLPKQIRDGRAWTYPGGEVTYRTNEHTNEPVMLYAKGDSAALFEKHIGKLYPGTKLLDNTDIFHVMLEAVGLAQTNTTSLVVNP